MTQDLDVDAGTARQQKRLNRVRGESSDLPTMQNSRPTIRLIYFRRGHRRTWRQHRCLPVLALKFPFVNMCTGRRFIAEFASSSHDATRRDHGIDHRYRPLPSRPYYPQTRARMLLGTQRPEQRDCGWWCWSVVTLGNATHLDSCALVLDRRA